MPEFTLHNEITRLPRKLIPSVVLPCAAPRRDVRWRFRETASPIVELGTITFPGARVGGMPCKPSRDQQSAQSDRPQRLTPALRQRRSSSRGASPIVIRCLYSVQPRIVLPASFAEQRLKAWGQRVWGAAACGRVDRARHVAFEDDAPARRLGIGDRHGRQQRLGVGGCGRVKRAPETP
jgi:hypothetical protein